jgi:hypothetical protein
MPVTDWTLTRGSYVIGTDSGGLKTGFTLGGWPDIWQVPVRSHDTDYEGQDGSHAGIDTRGALLLTFEWRIVSAARNADAVMDNIATARTAFAPTSTDVTITVVAPGSRSIVFTGRPRNFTSRGDDLHIAAALCQASFYVPTGVPTTGAL